MHALFVAVKGFQRYAYPRYIRLTGSHDSQGHQHFLHRHSAMLVSILEIIDKVIVIIRIDEKVMVKRENIF